MNALQGGRGRGGFSASLLIGSFALTGSEPASWHAWPQRKLYASLRPPAHLRPPRPIPPRVIVGKEYYETHGIEPEVPVEAALGCILQQKIPRTRVPGTVLASSQFPATYFSVSGMEQWFGPELLTILDDMSGVRLRLDGKEPDYWRFNRVNGAWVVRAASGTGATRAHAA
jgi:hypothetical protein